MENEQNEVIQHIQETSKLFTRLYAKHGNYFLAEYQPHANIMKDFFAAISIRDLKEALQLPNNIFKGLIETELDKRKVRAGRLKARGRLIRGEEQVCLT